MDITIHNAKLSGTVHAIPSKSQAHRLLICAAFSDVPTQLVCPEINQDIEATADCLRSLGADIVRNESGYYVKPIIHKPTHAELNCRESGSTLRFMLPIVGSLGVDAVFLMEGRLPQRPLSPLWEEMERMGCTLTRPTENTIACTGKLRAGTYHIAGNISSQFISGLLFALSLLPDESQLVISGEIESLPYINMTKKALSAFGVDIQDAKVSAGHPFSSPGQVHVEGDWSNAAFFLAAKTLGSDLHVAGLQDDSPQGDREVLSLLKHLKEFCIISATDIPDLVPILAVVAGANQGATFTGIRRLRLKESDRVETIAAMLRNLGANVTVTEDTLTIMPAKFQGCTIDSANDHRIAMSAAIAATIASGPVTVRNAQCVSKSYPAFWNVYRQLGGYYE